MCGGVDVVIGMMIRQVSGETKIAFCPWSAGPLSYLGLRGKRAEAGRDIAKLTNWEQPNIQMTTI